MSPKSVSSVRRPSFFKLCLALVLLAVTVAVAVSLGRWQLGRAEQKRQIMAAVQEGRSLPALELRPTSVPSELTPWRPVLAHGRWLADKTVLLDNRAQDGRPGFWVVTPLALDHARPGQAVAVLRGWVPREFTAQAVAPITTPTGDVEVRGELISHVPRLFELGDGKSSALTALSDASGLNPPRVQNLDLAAYGLAAGLELMPVVLQQTGVTVDGLKREWAGPPSNIDTHRGYALQWFSFAAIAAIAFGVLLVRYFRSPR